MSRFFVKRIISLEFYLVNFIFCKFVIFVIYCFWFSDYVRFGNYVNISIWGDFDCFCRVIEWGC